ncbi:HAMP domain-containing histidine kinase [Bradyrhizobium sp. ISRA443]|uniref:sensor histidine kinase n=1 Tax=unclassified Bradyrhizobium TaxID=2631580 RepID=UPI002478C4E7|nr:MULTISPECIES: HAMP domain-containing sensor histidine kinase [unclassified Bradyrhizobium]WGR95600.1 HAMP domain-containing histidine kinase [Bradyrhizobium sp. ISRA435]WGS00659.1 HAMP domain-containing histidine kinase [Bradyrhizobium sp. ISRA436]WGS07547.1 HAMP domain-containing histidine kinase [Bradyrhizobium sp. ISRA437]WGS14434.1 HAMP domain-containing histidine kinase [Bradyrhizobium sp. ISRA443]
MLLAKTLRSSTFRLALMAIGAFGLIVCAIFAYVYWSTVSYVRSRSDRAIMTEQANLHDAYARSGRDGLVALIGQRIADKSFADHVYLLVDHASAVLAGNLARWPVDAADQGWAEFRAPARSPASVAPLVRGVTETLPNGDRLLVGRDIGDLDGFTAQIRAAGIAVVVLIVVLAAVASIGVTRRTVGRIESINATSRAIMLSGLDQRIPLHGSHDEWDRVAENLNQMLDRIQTLMGEVKQASDNIAHDLRTPLTRMRGRLEKAYHCPRNGENDAALIGDTIADLDTVLAMFASITRISEIETRARKDAFRIVNLVEIAGEVVELYDAAAERDTTRLELAGDAEVPVIGDRDLLFDAIANLVDNAIKHGRAGGRVTVTCRNGESGAVISVADDGSGIPTDQHDHVFKRFYRLEQSRYTPGNGLGLSLVAAVASLHGATIELRDNSPGLLVVLCFPASVAA